MQTAGVILVLAAAVALAAKLPSNFQRCSRKDPKFNECLAAAAQDAIQKLKAGAPHLGVFSLDPLEVTTIDLGQSSDGPVNLGFKFDNVKLYGISQSTLSNQKSDLKDFSLSVDAFTPTLRMESDYTIDGKVLLLPIKGKGKSVITLKNLKSKIEQKGVIFDRNGQPYVNETAFIYKMYPEKVELKFDNLFNGEPTLGENMNKFLNENWQEVLKEVQVPLENAMGQVFMNIANRIFLKVPVNEIFPED